MLLAAFALVVGALAAAAAGGRLRNLRDVRVRLPLLPILCLAVLVALPRTDLPHPRLALTASWAVLATFAVVNLTRVRGMWLVLLGVAANLAVVAVNGVMPYRPSALEAAEVFPDRVGAPLHADVVTRPERAGDRLLVLSRQLPVAPFHTVVSGGDLALAGGLGLVVFHALTPPLPESSGERRRRGRRRRPGRRLPRLTGGGGRHARTGRTAAPTPSARRVPLETGRAAEALFAAEVPTTGSDPAWDTRRRLALLTDDPRFLTAGAAPERPGPAAPAVVAAAAVRQALAAHELRADSLFGVMVDLSGTPSDDEPLPGAPRVVIDLAVGHDAQRASH